MSTTTAAASSLQRTYRYLRMGIAGSVAVIFIAVLQATASVGWLPALSDYFYTPARTAFTGALIAVALGLFAISGRGGDRVLIDAAALFAPLIALIPTTVVPGTLPDVAATCTARCFPPEYTADAANGVITYLLVAALGAVVAWALAATGQVSVTGTALSIAITSAVLILLATMWTLAPEIVLEHGHFVATIAFFVLFAAVALRAAFPRVDTPPAPPFRAAYIAIAAGLVFVMLAYAVLLPQDDGDGLPIVLIAESAALLLFLAFWVVESIEKWDSSDPRVFLI